MMNEIKINSSDEILNYIKNNDNIYNSKVSCLVGLSIFGTDNSLPIQRYIISIRERENFKDSIKLFLKLSSNIYYKNYIYYSFLKYLENQIDSIEYFRFLKRKYKDEFIEIFIKPNLREEIKQKRLYVNINHKSNHLLNSILDSLYSNLNNNNSSSSNNSNNSNSNNNLSSFITETESLNHFFNPISYLLNNSNSNDQEEDCNNLIILLDLIDYVCKYLNENHYYQYSVLFYLFFKQKLKNKILKFLNENNKKAHHYNQDVDDNSNNSKVERKDEEMKDKDVEVKENSNNKNEKGKGKFELTQQLKDEIIKKINNFWFNGLNNLKLFLGKFKIENKEFKLNFSDENYQKQQQEELDLKESQRQRHLQRQHKHESHHPHYSQQPQQQESEKDKQEKEKKDKEKREKREKEEKERFEKEEKDRLERLEKEERKERKEKEKKERKEKRKQEKKQRREQGLEDMIDEEEEKRKKEKREKRERKEKLRKEKEHEERLKEEKSSNENYHRNLNNELFLKGINEFCLPLIFSIDKDAFGQFNKLDMINYCWKYYICKRDGITDKDIVDLQSFLQQFSDSGRNLKRHPNQVILNFKVDLLENPEKTRNDYFDRNTVDTPIDDEIQDSNDSYEFEIHLGIYLLASIFYVSCWRYFKFLSIGSSRVENQYPENDSFNNGINQDMFIDSTLEHDFIAIDTNDDGYCQISNGNVNVQRRNKNNNNNNINKRNKKIKLHHDNRNQDQSDDNDDDDNDNDSLLYDREVGKPKLSMIVHQLLIYSNIDDESVFDDQFSEITFTGDQKDATRHLALCMECYSDLNQDPWMDDFKSILSTIWNNPKFYWLYNSLADSNYYYETYSTSLKFYKDVKILLSTEFSRTEIPLGNGYIKLFNPKNDLWLNRLALNISVTNHTEIEESISGLLEILSSIPIPDQLQPSTHTFKTIKPFFTDFTDDDILFWCIDGLVCCYEKLGMVGEMTVLYQAYWEYYKPRFIQMINEIKGTPQNIPNEIPFSNLVKKDLQFGYFFPRFFEYIINIEMLEEFSYILNKGSKLDILPRGQSLSSINPNKELIDILTRHITRTSSNTNYTLTKLLKHFISEELEHFSKK